MSEEPSLVLFMQVMGLGGVTTVAVLVGYGLMMVVEACWRWWERRD